MNVNIISSKVKLHWHGYIVIGLLLTVNLLINFMLIKYADYTWIVVIYNLSIVVVVVSYLYIKNLPTFLLILGILPLAYIDNIFSLYFNYIIIQNIPIYLFFALSIFYFTATTENVSLNYGYLTLPIYLITIYSSLLFILGFMKGGVLSIVTNELYQHLYYFLAIPIIYLIKDRRNLIILFSALAITFLIVSFQYIYLNLFSDMRITTYHNVFLSFLLGFFYSKLLFKQNNINIKLVLIIGISIVWIASILINTRILWICNLLTMATITFFYLRNYPKMLRWFKYFSVLTLVLLVALLFNYSKESTIFNPEKTQERLESLSDPLGDLSFLMRIEIGQASFYKFLESPIWGEGFGKQLKFKIFTDTEVYFIDNSFLYFLWKGGLISLFLFSLLFYRIIYSSYIIFDKSEDITIKILSISILGGVVSFIFYGLLSASLIGYKLNLLYAIIIGYLEFERNNLLKNEKI